MTHGTGTQLRPLIFLITALLLASFARADVSLERRGPIVIAGNGRINLQIHLDRGTVDYLPVDAPGKIVGAAAGIVLQSGSSRLLTTQYPSHALVDPSLSPLADRIGNGRHLIVRHWGLKGSPALEQVFRVYDNRPFVLIELRAIASDLIRSNWISPLIVDRKDDDVELSVGPGGDPRLLEVPFDNDDWHRFNARHLDGGGVFSGTSFEFTTIFNLPSDRSWVIGSVTHDFWKTGIDFRAGSSPGRLDGLTVYGGVATSDQPGNKSLPHYSGGTHDICPHGAMDGTTIQSPAIFVGFFGDFRDGLSEFGRVSAAIAPPLPWKYGPPFGWLSFGAVPQLRLEDVIGASDFLHDHLQPKGFSDARGRVCVNIDGNNFSADQLRKAAEHIHHNGQLAGYYLSPFVCWGRAGEDPLAQPVDQTGLTFSQIALRDEQDRPIPIKEQAYALDATHPATLQWIGRQIGQARQMGFDYFKLDFLSAGAMEGRHHDPEIRSGIQAYNRAMRFIVQAIGPDKFISLSIAPMFPSQYGHSRRVSCDIYSQLTDLHWPPFRNFGSTEYMLSCDTFLWWMAGSVYAFNDPDEIQLSRFERGDELPKAWVKTRIASAIVCGGNFIDADPFDDPVAAQRAEEFLTNPRINAVARQGIAFHPVLGALGSQWSDKHTGADAADVFYRDDSAEHEKTVLLAIFNFDSDHPAEKRISFGQIGLGPSRHFQLTDLWTGNAIECEEGEHTWNLPPGEAALVRIAPGGR
jgi:alpha-galactosidase